MTNPIRDAPTRAFIVSELNSRGIIGKFAGGDHERDRAARIRAWADHLVYEFLYDARIFANEAKLEDFESKIWRQFSR